MKTKLTARTAAIAAFIGLIQVAHAQTTGHAFTPIEDLLPEQRQQIIEKLNELTRNMKIDWDHIAVGINENGEITLLSKSEAGLQTKGSPSSFGSMKEKEGCE